MARRGKCSREFLEAGVPGDLRGERLLPVKSAMAAP